MARRSRNRGDTDRDGFIKTTRQPQQPLKERWRFLIEGSVQGVGFRQSCRQRAIELGLCGWVRNLKDGSVEVQAEGGERALNELRLWCERGPSTASVSRVLFSKIPVTGHDCLTFGLKRNKTASRSTATRSTATSTTAH